VIEPPVMIEISILAEAAASPTKIRAGEAAPEGLSTDAGAAKAATDAAAAESICHVAATTTEPACRVAPAAASHMAAATTTATTARERISGQSAGQSDACNQYNYGVTQHCTYSFGQSCPFERR
jgi:hypothetical protein